MANQVKDILIEERERLYRVFFPYRHEIGWRGFKQLGMMFKEPHNVGGSPFGVFWQIPKDKIEQAKDLIHYWYTENPQAGHSVYGVVVAPLAASVSAAPSARPTGRLAPQSPAVML